MSQLPLVHTDRQSLPDPRHHDSRTNTHYAATTLKPANTNPLRPSSPTGFPDKDKAVTSCLKAMQSNDFKTLHLTYMRGCYLILTNYNGTLIKSLPTLAEAIDTARLLDLARLLK